MHVRFTEVILESLDRTSQMHMYISASEIKQDDLANTADRDTSFLDFFN